MTPKRVGSAPISCVVFDFDGVLLQSNAIKRDVYFKVFEDFPPAAPVIEECLNKFPDVNRVELIRRVIDQLSDQHSSVIFDQDALVNSYSRICEDDTSTCPEVEGTTFALVSMSENLPLYINSATVEDSLRRVVKRRDWTKYFRGVYGTPTSKSDNLRLIIAKEEIMPESILFVGDGDRDLRAALELGCQFLGIRNEFNDFHQSEFEMLDDLTKLFHLVTKYV